jgi:NADH dehydrogenase/NADH:ubiquinone oxidoreductase subunit G
MMTKSTKITLKINGKKCQVPSGTTILEAAKSIGINIPIICLHDATTAEGLCRQCVVEVEGWSRLAPACITEVTEGMDIQTESKRVVRSRRTILEMLNASVDLSQAPGLNNQMERYDVNPERFPGAKKRQDDLLDDNPFYVRDYSQCILCWRCVQACADDMQYTYALGIGGRGHDTEITTFFDAPMPDTTCVFCGNCVGVCPTNSLQDKTEFLLQQGLQHDEIRARRRQERKDKRSKK